MDNEETILVDYLSEISDDANVKYDEMLEKYRKMKEILQRNFFNVSIIKCDDWEKITCESYSHQFELTLDTTLSLTCRQLYADPSGKVRHMPKRTVNMAEQTAENFEKFIAEQKELLMER